MLIREKALIACRSFGVRRVIEAGRLFELHVGACTKKYDKTEMISSKNTSQKRGSLFNQQCMKTFNCLSF